MKTTKNYAGGELHRMLRRSARDQMLYAFIEGMRLRDQAVSIDNCILSFCDRFGVENLDAQNARVLYYRMIQEFRSDLPTLKEQLNVEVQSNLIDLLAEAIKQKLGA